MIVDYINNIVYMWYGNKRNMNALNSMLHYYDIA